jgi:hypothetical protein
MNPAKQKADELIEKYQQEIDDFRYMAEGLQYDHQLSAKLELLRKADAKQEILTELKSIP